MKIYFRTFFQIFCTVLPGIALAQSGQVIRNPLAANTLTELLSIVLTALLEVGIPLLVLAFVYTGFLFVAAGGDPGKLTKARQAFMTAVIGAFIILGAFVLQHIIEGTVSKFLAA